MEKWLTSFFIHVYGESATCVLCRMFTELSYCWWPSLLKVSAEHMSRLFKEDTATDFKPFICLDWSTTCYLCPRLMALPALLVLASGTKKKRKRFQQLREPMSGGSSYATMIILILVPTQRKPQSLICHHIIWRILQIHFSLVFF